MTGQPPPTPDPSPDMTPLGTPPSGTSPLDTPSLDTHPLITSSPDTSPLEATLHAAGFPVDLLTDEQRLVLSELTTEELTLLLDVKSRLDAVGPEVQAHGEIAGGALF